MGAATPLRPTTYATRRNELEQYFDQHAVEAWAALTSDAPVSKVRATVRAGRDAMRGTILKALGPLEGLSLLDAGCGTGALSAEAAAKGAAVTAVDISPTLVALGRERYAAALPEGAPSAAGRIAFSAGDMLAVPGRFTHAVAMDSLIHYRLSDIIAAISALAPQVDHRLVFTVAPRTPALTLMHAAGKLFPRGDRSPAIVPVTTKRLIEAVANAPLLKDFALAGTSRIQSGFYTSEAVVLERLR
ncbi:MAG: magnesium protoporphyrin IX methyltransferase [Pseudomonadota bacterium]